MVSMTKNFLMLQDGRTNNQKMTDQIPPIKKIATMKNLNFIKNRVKVFIMPMKKFKSQYIIHKD